VKVGDLVKMDFEDLSWDGGDMWGVGMIVEITDQTPDDVCVLWSCPTRESWEMKTMLDLVDESR